MLVINIWKNVKLRIQYAKLFEVDCFLVLILKQAGLSVNICAKAVKLRIQYTELFEVDCFLVLILKQAGLSVNICAKAAIKLDLKTKLVIRFY